MKKALITGVTGQDGSYLSELLLEKDYKVYGLKRRTSSNGLGNVSHLVGEKNFEIVEGDVTDLSSMISLVKSISPDEMYNLAAQSEVGTSFKEPFHTLSATGAGVLNCLESIRQSGNEKKTKFYQACHDEKTNVVTPSGIKPFTELKVGDDVFSFNEQTHQMEKKQILKIYKFPYDGKMISLEGKRISQLITPNHRVILKDDNNNIVSCRAENIKNLFSFERKSHLSMPFITPQLEDKKENIKLSDLVPLQELSVPNCFHKNLITSLPSKDLFYLLGLYIGDGYKASGKKLRSYPFKENEKRRDKKTGRYTAEFNFEGTPPTTGERYLTSHTILFAIPEKDPARSSLLKILDKNKLEYSKQKMTITLTSLPLSKIFSLCGKNVYEKQIPDFAFSYSVGNLRALLQGVIDSDGSERKTKSGERASITTVSSILASQLLFLIKKCGYHPSIKNVGLTKSYIKEGDKVREIKSTKEAFYINVSFSPKNKLYSYMISEVEYKGNVWCLEIKDNHNFLIERNGKTAISGNSTSEMLGGLSGGVPYDENSPFHPRSPYGVAKVYGHYLTINYRESYNMFACSGILMNHESKRRGPYFVTQKIAQAVAKISNNEQDFLYLGNLEAKRDWSHAKDCIRAMYLMLQQETPEEYIISSETCYSVRDFCKEAFNCVGLNYEEHIRIDPKFYRPAEVHVLIGNSTKAHNKLGWYPEISFEELVGEMVEKALKK